MKHPDRSVRIDPKELIQELTFLNRAGEICCLARWLMNSKDKGRRPGGNFLREFYHRFGEVYPNHDGRLRVSERPFVFLKFMIATGLGGSNRAKDKVSRKAECEKTDKRDFILFFFSSRYFLANGC
jgi:hypothetical protein